MATSQKAFRRRVDDHLPKKQERETILVPIEDYYVDDEGNEVVTRRNEFNFSRPTQEQLLLAFAMGGREDSTVGDEVSAIFSFMKDTLPDNEYKVLVRRFRDPNDDTVNSDLLIEIFQMLMEEWQSFPTQQPSGSSGSQGSSGGRSTGRARGKGSTR